MSDQVESLLYEVLLELKEVNSNLQRLDEKLWSLEYDVGKIKEELP